MFPFDDVIMENRLRRATIITQLIQRLSSYFKHLLSISCVYLLLTKPNQYAICGPGILQMVSNHLRLILKDKSCLLRKFQIYKEYSTLSLVMLKPNL